MSSVHTPSLMSRIPPEIFLEFGIYLDGPSLLSALQVSRQWQHILGPLMWTTITDNQWSHRRFPIQPNDDITVKAILQELQQQLHLVRHLEFPDPNHKLYSVVENLLCTPRLWYPRCWTVSQLTFQRTLGLTPELRSLTIKTSDFDLKPALEVLCRLENLRRLVIDIRDPNGWKATLESLLPWFAQLDELDLGGEWYAYDRKECMKPLQKTETALKLRKLAIGLHDLPLLRYCPDLLEIELRSIEGGSWRPDSLRPLVSCPKLEVFKLLTPKYDLNGDFNQTLLSLTSDFADTLSALKNLRVLAYPFVSPNQVEFLLPLASASCSSDGYVSESSVRNGGTSTSGQIQADRGSGSREPGLRLPLLEHFETTVQYTDEAKLHAPRLLPDILRTRPKLKGFIVRDYDFSPWDIFVRPGSEQQEWACKGLQTLTIRFSEGSCQLDLLEWHQLSESIRRQAVQLTELKSLKIQSQSLKELFKAVILGAAPMANLQSLSLLDESPYDAKTVIPVPWYYHESNTSGKMAEGVRSCQKV
ncbi:hypothetical protein BGX28_007371 [Mortierella sp. GBA30]|nr:hypothetical protein BGX28_007371 [Mortierella sp. GBA30]